MALMMIKYLKMLAECKRLKVNLGNMLNWIYLNKRRKEFYSHGCPRAHKVKRFFTYLAGSILKKIARDFMAKRDNLKLILIKTDS
jgi:hypothetical protein